VEVLLLLLLLDLLKGGGTINRAVEEDTLLLPLGV